MKKVLKHAIALSMALMIMVLPLSVAFAESIYYADGYQYTYINNEKVSLYGADDAYINPLMIPSILNNRAVVDIRNRAFFDNTVLSSVDFSNADHLERIGSFAFANCANLDGEIVIPSTVTTIETAAFQNCASLDSVVFNASSGSVPNQCFNECTSLSSVTLNDTVKRIGYYAFSNCPNLTYIEIPASVTDIAISAFQSDTAITLGVYTDSFAHHYAVANDISFVLLDAPAPTEPPTEPETEPVTEAPTEPVTEAPTEPATELLGYILGDVDNNGVVESIDATWIQRYSVQMELPIPEENMVQGDVDGDGETNVYDVTFIQRYVVDILTPYDIGKFIAL
jgi:hypothetical protein